MKRDVLSFQVDLAKALVLIPEVRFTPEMTSETGNVFSRKVNISILNGTAVTFTVNTLHLVRNLEDILMGSVRNLEEILIISRSYMSPAGMRKVGGLTDIPLSYPYRIRMIKYILGSFFTSFTIFYTKLRIFKILKKFKDIFTNSKIDRIL